MYGSTFGTFPFGEGSNDYRFFVNEHDGNGTPTILRGRPYRLPDDWDTWSNYWAGDQMVAVYDDKDYRSPTRADNPDWTERAEHAIKMCYLYNQDTDDVLTRLAVRLFDHDAPNARFVPVGLDRGVTLYALSWDGDPDGTWANEIQAVAWGDVYRVEVEEWDGEGWTPADDSCEEWYGEANAIEQWHKDYPLDAFPQHLVIGEAVGA